MSDSPPDMECMLMRQQVDVILSRLTFKRDDQDIWVGARLLLSGPSVWVFHRLLSSLLIRLIFLFCASMDLMACLNSCVDSSYPRC